MFLKIKKVPFCALDTFIFSCLFINACVCLVHSESTHLEHFRKYTNLCFPVALRRDGFEGNNNTERYYVVLNAERATLQDFDNVQLTLGNLVTNEKLQKTRERYFRCKGRISPSDTPVSLPVALFSVNMVSVIICTAPQS